MILTKKPLLCFATKFINIGEFWLTGKYCNLSIIGFIIINCYVNDIIFDRLFYSYSMY